MDESRTLLDCCTPLATPTLSVEQASALEQLFGALADRHRLRILNLLIEADGEPVCVCEFTASLGLPQPSVSYHLKQLMDTGLLVRERRARFAYYSIAPHALERLGALIDLSAASGVPA
jgi:ArsR family transcriptional regulator